MKFKHTFTALLLSLSINNLAFSSSELLPMVDYIKKDSKYIDELNIEFYNKGIAGIDNLNTELAIESFNKIQPTNTDISVKKYFALFKIDNDKYFAKLDNVLNNTNNSQYIYQKMFLNIYKYNLNPEQNKKSLLENKLLFKNSFNGLKENILLTETLILLQEYKEALNVFSNIKEVDVDIYTYLLIINEKNIAALNFLTEIYRTENRNKTEETPEFLEKMALREWLIMFTSLKTNSINTFKQYSELFLENDPLLIKKIISKHNITANPNYSKFGFKNLTEEMMELSSTNNFFHIENIVYFTSFMTEDLKKFIAKSSHSDNLIKINLKNILHSKSDLYKKTREYISELKKLPEELETIEYFNAGLLLAKINKYNDSVHYFKKSFIKNNIAISGTLYLTLNKFTKTESLKNILVNKYVNKIKQKVNSKDEYLISILDTFIWNTNRWRYKSFKKNSNINANIINNYIYYINTKNNAYLDRLKEADPYLNLLHTLFYRINSNKYDFISHIQDNIISDSDLYQSKEPLVGKTYVKMLKMINFIDMPDFNFQLNDSLVYNPTYLLNYTNYLAYKGMYNKSASVFESFINKSNIHLSLEEKILYSFINFKSNEKTFDYLVQVNLDNEELNLIKVIHYLNNNDYELLNKHLKNGIKENLFLFKINNQPELFEGK